MIRTYSELSRLKTFDERFEYLKLDGKVAQPTFGFERYLNQLFYTSAPWREARDKVIIRDNGCDLGLDGYEIFGRIYVHHMNPITAEDIRLRRPWILDPEFLICVSWDTHQAITFGDKNLLTKLMVERRPGDTKLW
jgi:hypothetical protein